MKSVNKIITVFASACFTLSSCDIDPVLTSSYPDDITWSNETNLQLYINGFYSLIGGYYSITDDACADLLKANNPAANTNLFVFGSTPITSASNLFDNWNNRHSWQLTCCRALEGLEKHRENLLKRLPNVQRRNSVFSVQWLILIWRSGMELVLSCTSSYLNLDKRSMRVVHRMNVGIS